MGPTCKRDLVIATVVVAVAAYLLVTMLYHWFPPITLRTGLPLLAIGVAEAGWGWYLRARIRDGKVGFGPGRVPPLAVARSVVVAKASAWVGAVTFGWWLGVLAYVLPRRDELRVAALDTPGSSAAAICALALVVAALWLQHCCRSPADPPEKPDSATE